MVTQLYRSCITGREPSFNLRTLCAVFGFTCVALTYVSIATSQTLESPQTVAKSQTIGFTEAYKKIDLSSDELGSIAELFVKEGDFVAANAPIAQLDTRLQKLQLEIATQIASNRSSLNSAEQVLKKRESILNRLRQLQTKGHAGDSEIIRAEMELAIATSRHLSAQEDLAVREIEQRRAAMELKRRLIVAPFDGVVSKIHRYPGEFLSPIKPEVVSIVQIDRLYATFNVSSSKVSMFNVGDIHQLELSNGSIVEAVVEHVGVVTDAQSGTIEIKLVIDNADGSIRSGESIILNI